MTGFALLGGWGVAALMVLALLAGIAAGLMLARWALIVEARYDD